MTDAAPRPARAPRPTGSAPPHAAELDRPAPEPGGPTTPGDPTENAPSGSLAHRLRSTQRAPGPAGRSLADAPNRAVALILDMIVVGFIGILIAASFGRALGGVVTDRTLATSGGELAIGPSIVVLVIVLALSLVYFVACWTRWQATPGMRLLGLSVLDQEGGSRLSARQAVVRWLLVGIPATIATLPVWVPSLAAVLLAILGAIALVGLLVTIGQDPARQGLHDRHAGSIVTTVGRRAARSS